MLKFSWQLSFKKKKEKKTEFETNLVKGKKRKKEYEEDH